MNWSLLIRALVFAAVFAVSGYAFDIEAVDPDAVETAGDRRPPPREPPGDDFVVDDDGGDADVSSESTDDGIVDSDVPPSIPAVSPEPGQKAVVGEPERRAVRREELGRLSREELFRLAFGRAAVDRPRELTLVLIAEGRELGNTDIVYNESFTEFEFISPALSRCLDTILLPEARPAAGDSIGYFRTAVLRAAGYTVTADEQSYVLHLAAPPESKSLQRTNLKGGYDWTPRGVAVKPAYVSFYLNYYLNDAFTYAHYAYTNRLAGGEKITGDDFLRTPAYLNFDGALNLFGQAVLEGSGFVSEPSEGRPFAWDNFGRGDVRLVREFVGLRSRLTAGDVGMGSGAGTVGGVQYEYNEGFYNNDPRDGESGVVFFMPRAGIVEVYMDGIYRQRFYLLAGQHEIRGFGGDVGRNNVRLVLRMVDGSVEEVPFQYVLGDPRGLRRGESRYAATAGVRREAAPSPACYRYDFNEPAVSAYYMYGLTRHVSVGATGMSSRYNHVYGAQALMNLGPVGWLDLRGTANYAPEAEDPRGGRVDASYLPNAWPVIRRLNRLINESFSLGGIDRGPLPNLVMSLGGYLQSAAYNPNAFRGVSYDNAVMGGVSGSLGFGLLSGSVMAHGSAVLFRETEAFAEHYRFADYNYGVRVSQRIFRIPISAGAGEVVRAGERSPYFSVNMSHAFGVGGGYRRSIRRHQISASADIGTSMYYSPVVLREIEYSDTVLADPDFEGPWYELDMDNRVFMSMGGGANLDWRWSNGGSGNGAQSYSATTRVSDIFDPEFTGLRANMRHTYNRAQLMANYGLISLNTSSALSGQTHYLNAALSGSLMFADGLWALGRPVYDGFVLAEAKHSFKGANVHVNRSHYLKRDYSRSGWLGAAYHNGISSHFPSPLTLTITDAPPGAMLENNRFYALGGYKQGYALRLGSKEGVLMAAVITSGGKPVSYVYATVEPEGSKGEQDRRATFTGGDGTLQMSGLAPGKSYRIKFAPAAGIKDVVVTVPRGSDLVFETEVEVDRLAD